MKGDAIDVAAVYITGELSITITGSNGNTIYEAHNPRANYFRVADKYTISVTGKQEENSVSFRIIRNER